MNENNSLVNSFLSFIIILERKDKKRNDRSFRLIKRKERNVHEIRNIFESEESVNNLVRYVAL